MSRIFCAPPRPSTRVENWLPSPRQWILSPTDRWPCSTRRRWSATASTFAGARPCKSVSRSSKLYQQDTGAPLPTGRGFATSIAAVDQLGVGLTVRFPRSSAPNGTVPNIARLRSRRRETDLSQGEKRELFSPQSAGLPLREGVRGGPRLPSHSTRPGLRRKSAVDLASRGRVGSVSSSE